MLKVEHIGIAVKDIVASNALFEALLGMAPYKEETVESEQVRTSFFQVADTKIELLTATDPSSAIARFLEKKGEGIHHVAFEVADIELAMQQLREKGFNVINEVPKRGADNKLVCFIYPGSANGVLVELCQTIRPELP